jgi:hypothetical protein
VADRLEGALRAFERAGRPAGDLHMIDVGALNVAAGQKAGADIAALAPADRPTAVFCTNDLIALGVLQEMTRHKIRVPEDISIVGYDDIDFAAAAAVPLTSVRQPRQQLGRTAARMLLEEAAAGDNHQHQQVIFEPELIVRQSTKATPAPRRAAPAGRLPAGRLPAGDGGQLLRAATQRTCLAGRPRTRARSWPGRGRVRPRRLGTTSAGESRRRRRHATGPRCRWSRPPRRARTPGGSRR